MFSLKSNFDTSPAPVSSPQRPRGLPMPGVPVECPASAKKSWDETLRGLRAMAPRVVRWHHQPTKAPPAPCGGAG